MVAQPIERRYFLVSTPEIPVTRAGPVTTAKSTSLIPVNGKPIMLDSDGVEMSYAPQKNPPTPLSWS
jgi:hypothetical protein